MWVQATLTCASALDATVAKKTENANLANATGRWESIVIKKEPSVATGVLRTLMQTQHACQLWWLMQTQHACQL